MTDAPRAAYYGEAPCDLGPLALPAWQEFMHYLYLPVRLPEREAPLADGDVVLPARLEFLRSTVYRVIEDLDTSTSGHLDDPYIYVTARRGFASPGNPLNRPGWHCDDFGGTDLNYIWSDRWPTRLLLADEPLAIPDDDAESMLAMTAHAERAWTDRRDGVRIEDAQAGHLLRLSPYVVHDTPLVPAPGGMRSFFKLSASSHRYDLLGNSHNHLLDYDWPMVSREALRNQPSGGNRDYSDQAVAPGQPEAG